MTLIVDGIKYKGMPGLYELIFKRIPDDTIYAENDKAYKSTVGNEMIIGAFIKWIIH